MVLFVYLITRNLYKSEKIGFILSLSFGFSTFIWPYVNSFVSRPLSMLFLLIGIWLLLSYREKRKSYFPILLGIPFGLSILSHNIILLLFPIFLFIGIYEFKDKKTCSFFSLLYFFHFFCSKELLMNIDLMIFLILGLESNNKVLIC